MGIRKKIMLGFLCLGGMLAFSGMVSLFEFNRLSRHTRDLLNSSIENLSFSKTMLDAVQEQNTSLLHMVVVGNNEFDSVFIEARKELEAALAHAVTVSSNKRDLDSITTARDRYYSLIDDFYTTPGEKDIKWFMQMYGDSYLSLTSAIKGYMVTTQTTMLTKAESIENNAYRAIMPGIITLCVAILIVIIFAFLMDIYYIKPVRRMNSGLSSFLRHDFPYNVQVDGKDEISRLNHQIDETVMLARKRKKEE